MGERRYALAMVATGVLCGACATLACSSNPPTLNGVVPGTGYPRQLLAVDGTTAGAGVVWDAGTAAEMVLYTGVFGTKYFQIPENATAGPHTVAVRTLSGTSITKTVTVLAPAPVTFPHPRIEDVGILTMNGAGPVDLLLTVAAANLDVTAHASVQERDGGNEVDRTVAETYLWGGLPIDYQQAHKPETFDYPVYHYAQLLIAVEDVTLGTTLHVTVTNADGQIGTFDYEMPGSVADLDSDGDGLLNSWEENGYNAPSGKTISLAALGTDKWKKDVLIEVDQTPDVKIKASLWDKVESAFREAPVLNPDGSAGITAIIDHGQGGEFVNGGQDLPAHDCLTLENPAPAPPDWCTSVTSFYDYKRDFFDADRLELFHYVVWGSRYIDARAGDSERWGNDFAVTLADYAQNIYAQVGTFMHELGHNLGLSHGNLYEDTESYTWKPNLPSIMTYRYQGIGIDTGCDLQSNFVFTFSQGTMKPLDEMNVNEPDGVCDHMPVNMDMVAGTTTVGQANLNWMPNEDGADMDTNDVWHDFDQWGHVHLNFRHGNSMWDSN